MLVLSLKDIKNNNIPMEMKIASTQILLYKNHFPLEGTYVESWMNPCLWQRK